MFHATKGRTYTFREELKNLKEYVKSLQDGQLLEMHVPFCELVKEDMYLTERLMGSGLSGI